MVLWQSPDTPIMSGFHVSARLRVRSLVCVSYFMLERGVRIPALMSWVSVLCRGSDTHAPFSVIVWVGGLEFARPHALLSTCVLLCFTQFLLSAACIHVMSCAVWHAACVFHWLHAFMLSCIVWTRGLWVFSLAVCSCLVLHMTGELFAGHVLVFLFCVSTWLLSKFSVCYVLSCQFVLTPPILLPVYWLIFPSCAPSSPSSFAPFIISLCLQFRVGSLPYVGSSYVLCPALSSLVLSSLVLLASLFFPYGVVFVCFIYDCAMWTKKTYHDFLIYFSDFHFNHDFDTNRHALQL